MKFTVAVNMCDPSHYLPLATQADRNGWHSVCVPDGPFYPETVTAKYPYTPDGSRFWPSDSQFMEPWVVIPAMAAVTERVRFFTHVLKLPIRNPLLVAKTVSSAAVLSGNRVGLGVGLSWIPEEAKWCGTDFATRGPRTNEAIEILRLCMGGGMVEYHGKHYDFDRLEMAPVPSEPVPIYVGGHSMPALRRAARLADGWSSANLGENELTQMLETLAELRASFGREDVPFEIQALCTDVFDRDGFHRLESLGVTEAIVWPWPFYGGDPTNLEDKKTALARFADDVIADFATDGDKSP